MNMVNYMNLEDINVSKELKVVFMGTPEFSVPILEALIDNYRVRAIVTQPDQPVGRNLRRLEKIIKR